MQNSFFFFSNKLLVQFIQSLPNDRYTLFHENVGVQNFDDVFSVVSAYS